MVFSLLRRLLVIAEVGVTVGIDVSLSHTADSPSKHSSLSGVLYQQGSHDDPNDLRRIEYLTLTVPDLGRAARFYQEVLGATELPSCPPEGSVWCLDGAVRMHGDAHQAALFGRDCDDGVTKPNISNNCDWEVLSRIFLFQNGLVQLIQFAPRLDATRYFDLWEPLTSPVWLAQAHIDFWIEEGLDPNEWIAEVEERSAAIGMPEVKFNRPVPQETAADRDTVPQSKYANQAVGSAFDGLAWAYFKGHIGEQYEFYQMARTIKRAVGRAYCERGAVSTAFMDAAPASSDEKSLAHKMHGIYQYGFRTADLHRTVGFYAEALGGSLMSYPTHGLNIAHDDSAHWMILANETLAAYEYSRNAGISRDEAMRRFGVPNISESGENRLDHRFILFDNFVVEPLEYTDGLSFGADGFDPQLNHGTSLAYIGTVAAAFGLDEQTTWDGYLPALRRRLDRQGFRKVELPLHIAEFPADHPYSGLEYGYMKGPDGEAIALTRVTGRFQQRLHHALSSAGAVSTMFADTNPYMKGEMSRFCAYAQFDGRYEDFVV